MHLPGSPAPGTADYTSFRISFWSALDAGIIAGIIVGVLAGLAVWWFQLRFEDRRRRHVAALDAEVFRDKLRGIFAFANYGETDAKPDGWAGPGNYVTRVAERALALVRDQPINIWREMLPRERPFLDAVKEFQRAHLRFIRAAEKLDFCLLLLARDDTDRALFIMRSRGFSACPGSPAFPLATLLQILKRPETELPDREARFAKLAADPEVKELLPPYLSADKQLPPALEVLQKAVGDGE